MCCCLCNFLQQVRIVEHVTRVSWVYGLLVDVIVLISLGSVKCLYGLLVECVGFDINVFGFVL